MRIETDARTLADAWDAEAQALPIDMPAEQVAERRRLFYRAAEAAMRMPPEQLRAELVQYGRTIGTAVERAS